MIRICNREYKCIHFEDLNRQELIAYFEDGNEETVLFLMYDDESDFYGCLTYECLKSSSNFENAISTERLYVSDDLFEKASGIFEITEKKYVVPVIGNTGEVLWFLYYDCSKYNEKRYYKETLLQLSKRNRVPNLLQKVDKKLKGICIYDVNELAVDLYKMCVNQEIPVVLLGHNWNYFGFSSTAKLNDYNQDEWLNIYSEGNACVKKQKPSEDVVDMFGFIVKLEPAWGGSVFYRDLIDYCADDLNNQIVLVQIPVSNIKFTSEQIEARKYNNLNFPYEIIKMIHGKETADYFSGSSDKFVDWRLLEYKFRGDANVPIYTIKSENFCGKRLYLIGPCIVAGRECLAYDTLAYKINEIVKQFGYEVFCVHIDNEVAYKKCEIIKELPFRKCDIAVVINREDFLFDYDKDRPFRFVDTRPLYEKYAGVKTLFSDDTMHTNACGNGLISEFIFEHGLHDLITKLEKTDKEYIQIGNTLDDVMRNKVFEWAGKIILDKGKDFTKGYVGSIVMNCNPFTKGHKYLIEKASEKVDNLIIFVVEEDKSDFCFSDRIEMVREGVSELGNVTVLSSGSFILSYQTMPLYFRKSYNRDAALDASGDLRIFGQLIAQIFNIKTRFVGEEPVDNVTKQYNEQMKELLPHFGVDVVEIERKHYKSGEKTGVISASYVRELLDEKEYDLLNELLPVTTINYLKEKGFIG